MTDSATIASGVPLSRDLARPYYLITTPDGVGHYLREQRPAMNSVHQSLFSRREPLTGILAPAVLQKAEGGTGSGRKRYRIEYQLSEQALATAIPLDSVTDSIIATFEEAVAEFLGDRRQLSPHEKQLRESFRLPDPELEPDAYWLYGEPGDRKLLILWGCEKVERSSIALRAGRNGERNLLDWLKSRRSGWVGMQREMLRLLQSGDYALTRWLAFPELDRKGAVKAYRVDGKAYPAKSFKRARHVSTQQIRDFERVAREFYGAVGRGSVAPVECELRAALKLPDPEVHPKTLLRFGKRVVVALPDGLRESDCLSLCEDEALGLPVTVTGKDGSVRVAETFLERLEQRRTPVKLYAALGAVAALLLIAGTFGAVLFADSSPPQLEAIIAENDPLRVELLFDEPIATPQAPDEGEPLSTLRVRSQAGEVIAVTGASVDAQDPALLVLQLASPLEDAGQYTLVFSGIVDQSMRANRMVSEVTEAFVWMDRKAPELLDISAEGSNQNQLLLFFSEALEPSSIASVFQYRIAGYRVVKAEFYQEDPSVVLLTAERESSGTQAEEAAGFIHMGEYAIELAGVRDASASRNPMEPVQRDFIFRDTVAPRISEVDASESQLVVYTTFSEPLDQASAENTGHYSIQDAEGEPLRVRSVQLGANQRTVRLGVDAMQAGVEYTLRVLGVADQSPEKNAISEEVVVNFNYRGPVDDQPPHIVQARSSDDRKELVVVFNEPVRLAVAEDPASYSIGGASVTVSSAERLGTEGVRFLLLLDQALPQATPLELFAKDITDRVGNPVRSESYRFQAQGAVWLDATLQPASADRSAQPLSPTTIKLVFNDAITADCATLIENFRLPSPYQIIRVRHLVDENAVVLELNTEQPLTTGRYGVEGRNLRLAADPNTPQATVRFSLTVP
jgi:methionine-rich copper-binding protein CopC